MMKTLIVAACLLSAGFVSPVFAANATHPYQNCDRKVDNCGPTGDDKVDQLNAQQLGSGPATPSVPTDGTASTNAPAPQGTSQ